MPIERHRRRLANGQERTYTYEVSPDGTRRSLSILDDSDSLSDSCYRSSEKKRSVAALLANASILIVGETGCGKTFLARQIEQRLLEQGFPLAFPQLGTAKEILTHIAETLGIDTETIEGKAMKTSQLQAAIADWLSQNTAFLILDNAHCFPIALRRWLEQLLEQGQPMLLLATFPPRNGIFIKLPRIELEPLKDAHIREIMVDEAMALGIDLTLPQLANLQQRTGGNPMLARRVVREEYLGLKDNIYDNTNWVDGTPFLIAALMCFMIMRFLGLGFNNTSLYLLGGIMTVAVGIIRIMLFSLPRQGSRLGQ